MSDVIQKISWQIRNMCELRKNYSCKLAFFNFVYDISGKLKIKSLSRWAFENKTRNVTDYFELNYRHIIEKYKKEELFVKEVKPDKFIIWFMWLEGYDNAPDLVKANYNKLVKINEGINKVIFLCQDNIDQYIDIPQQIKEKAGKEIIYSHYSDLIRAMLLSKYGGCWIDATCLVMRPFINERQMELFSCRTNGCNLELPANSEWVTWLLSSNKVGYKLFRFSEEMQIAFWSKENWVIDYLYHDYIIRCAYRNFPEIKEAIDNIPQNNTERNSLMYRMGKQYNDDIYNSDTWIYKLSYKKDYSLEINGKPTYYAKHMNGEL